MKNAIEARKFTRGATKTIITATGMTGTAIGAYHIKNLVSDVSDNEILGIAAGIGTLLLGAMVVNGINRGVDKAFEVKSPPLLLEVTPDDFEFEIEDDEGVDLFEQQIENL